jgi:hypothetical protein
LVDPAFKAANHVSETGFHKVRPNMITKEDAIEIAARYLRTNGYPLNKQEPECHFVKKSDVLLQFQSGPGLRLRQQCPELWESMVSELARDRWVFSFTVGEEVERVWQIVSIEVDAETGQPFA